MSAEFGNGVGGSCERAIVPCSSSQHCTVVGAGIPFIFCRGPVLLQWQCGGNGIDPIIVKVSDHTPNGDGRRSQVAPVRRARALQQRVLCHQCGQLYASQSNLDRHLRKEACPKETLGTIAVSEASTSAATHLKVGNLRLSTNLIVGTKGKIGVNGDDRGTGEMKKPNKGLETESGSENIIDMKDSSTDDDSDSDSVICLD